MTGFVIAMVALTGLALLFVLPALLRGDTAAARRAAHHEVNLAVLRDQSRELDADLASGLIAAGAYREARRDLEQRVAEDVQAASGEPAAATPPQRALALMLALALPALAAALYFQVGSPAGVNFVPPPAIEGQAHDVGEAEISAMVARLAARLETTPNYADGWYMLGRSYSALGRYADAAAAYRRLDQLAPNDPDVLADLADALGTAQDSSLKGEPEQLIARALAADPKHIKALALSGSAAFERGQYAEAAQQWRKVLELVPADSDFARSTGASIAQAEERAGVAAPQAVPEPAAPPAAPGSLSGLVELDPALRDQVAPTDTVFIYARAVEGPRIPLAVLRKQVKDLPLRFTLDDSSSMLPDMKLSTFPQLVVGARVSRSGSATAAPGDFEGVSAAAAPGSSGLRVRIATVRE